ncbi:DUF3895 domain-containing protein [Streptomyces avermitilis]
MHTLKEILTIEERDRIFNTLNDRQREFLQHRLLRSRRTIFARQMAMAKGAVIPDGADPEDIEKILDEWIYTGYVDAGKVSPAHLCECGRPLRYQHEVRHKGTGAVLYFGIKHLGDHLGLDAKTVSLIVKGFQSLDEELDDILRKTEEGWSLDDWYFQEGFTMPSDIQEHLDLGLPLLDRQVERLRRKLREYLDQVFVEQAAARKSRFSKTVSSPGFQEPVTYVQDSLPGFEEGRSVPHVIERSRAQGLTYEGHETELYEHFKPLVIEQLNAGIKSAWIISEQLLREPDADQRRYSTGKLHLYVPVCIYLDQLTLTGECRLLSKSSEDREYELT